MDSKIQIFCFTLQILLLFSQSFAIQYTIHNGTQTILGTFDNTVITSINDNTEIALCCTSIKLLESKLFDIRHQKQLISIIGINIEEIEIGFLAKQNTTGMSIKLSQTMIKTIKTHTFINLFLIEINFSHNPKLAIIEFEAFYSLKNLKTLILRFCLLTSLNSKAFKFLPELKLLDLAGNKIKTLPEKAFDWILNNSTLVNLHKNQMALLDENVFQNLRDYNFTIYLGYNKLDNEFGLAFTNHKFFHIDLSANNITELSPDLFASNFSARIFKISCSFLNNDSLTMLYKWSREKDVDLKGASCQTNGKFAIKPEMVFIVVLVMVSKLFK